MDDKQAAKYLGLDPPRDPEWFEDNPLVHARGHLYAREGRAAFEALVPDRYKQPPPPQRSEK